VCVCVYVCVCVCVCVIVHGFIHAYVALFSTAATAAVTTVSQHRGNFHRTVHVRFLLFMWLGICTHQMFDICQPEQHVTAEASVANGSSLMALTVMMIATRLLPPMTMISISRQKRSARHLAQVH